VKDLEDILAAPLVARGPRQFRLTPLGEDVAIRAREVLRAVGELAALARASAGPLSGRLRRGVIPTVGPYFLPDLIRQLARHFPTLRCIRARQ
jgi:LysR family hydrogen peroxide-inducible transcriptional activator